MRYWMLAVVALPIAATAGTIGYSFSGSPASLAATTTDPNVLAANADFIGSAASQFTGVGDALVITNPVSATSPAAAIANNSYFEITLTPLTTMSFTSLTFEAAYGPAPGAGDVVRSSVDGYTSDLLSGAVSGQYPTFSSSNIDLTDGAFQNVSSAITFRFYAYYNPGSSGPSVAFRNLTFTEVSGGGGSSVPEPATLAG